jgi:hypothetical protein
MVVNNGVLDKCFTNMNHWRYSNEKYPTHEAREGRVAFLRALAYEDIVQYECISTDSKGTATYFCVQYLKKVEDDEEELPIIEIPAPTL